MRKIFHLSTCSTCKRIIEELNLKDRGFEFQDIKTEPITADQLEEMRAQSGSYEALFSKVARKYKELNLKEANLQEADFRAYILEEYTFLKRPVIQIDDHLYIGNSKKVIAAAQSYLDGK